MNYNKLFTGSLGVKHYYLNNKHHRLDGPAIEYPNDYPGFPNYKAWFINGEQIGNTIGYMDHKIINNNEEFLRFMKLKIFW